MARKPLKEYFDKILENCSKDCEIGYDDPIEQEYCPETNCFNFEEDGYEISGSFDVVGKWGVSGDGYWEPREEYVTDIEVSNVCIDYAYWIDPETEEEIEIPQDEIDDLCSEIENSIPEMVGY